MTDDEVMALRISALVANARSLLVMDMIETLAEHLKHQGLRIPSYEEMASRTAANAAETEDYAMEIALLDVPREGGAETIGEGLNAALNEKRSKEWLWRKLADQLQSDG